MKIKSRIKGIFAIVLTAILVFSLSLLFSCSQAVKSGGDPSISVSPEVEAEYYKALSAIVKLDKKTVSQLKKDFEEQMESTLFISDGEAGQPGNRLSGTFCYGTFDNCIVIFSPTIMQAIGTLTVADEVFTHSTLFNLWGYCDGVFYHLSEAYEKDYITKEEVSEVAERHRAIGRYNSLCEKYKKAKKALKTPNGARIDSIDNAFKVNGTTAEWLDLDKKTMFTATHLRCYGNFNGCVVLLLTSQNTDGNSKIVAEHTFETSEMGILLWGYYEGTLYDLQEAFNRGFISQSDIGVALSRHKDVEHYIEIVFG